MRTLLLIFLLASLSGCFRRADETKLSYDPGPYPADVQTKLNYPLRDCITGGDVEESLALIEKGENLDFAYEKAVDSSPDTLTPLEYAEEHFRVETDPEERQKFQTIIVHLRNKLEELAQRKQMKEPNQSAHPPLAQSQRG